ncbi:hypothetical protein MSG28_004012 [Choristoneura fumiferana]|uniref:Uncharacterized protein n=1 Tax=Choristoneura fumiferana TaxID=7141 RepID=A0ACC0KH15_CHOFU|nr:hypothetical protein MSG28_004012 [Choristoneura fumiferana]
MTEDQQLSNENFNSIKDYPESLLSYIDKYVKVELIKNSSYSGFLHSIDPITFSVIISTPHEGNFKTIVIPGHAIIDLQEDTPSIGLTPPTRKSSAGVSDINVLKRKVQLTAWFVKNLLPVKEDGDSLVIGNVSVLPPYSVTDICAENPVVILQIRKIMEAMPVE